MNETPTPQEQSHEETGNAKREIHIGKFTLTARLDNSFWIEANDGEGMQVWENDPDFEKLIAAYWKENF